MHTHAHSSAPANTIDAKLGAPPSLEATLAQSPTELLARFRVGVERFDRRVLTLMDSQLDTAFQPEGGVGRWPARVLLGHLADAEVAFVHRMRRCVAEDGPLFSVWDENAFIDSGLYGTPETGPKFPIGGFIATIHTLRAWTGEWLTTLPESAFQRRAMHPERGEQSLRLILAYDTWHLEHHAWFLNLKVAKFLGPA
jgi:hypothetical protein